jgi:hypothetical protein
MLYHGPMEYRIIAIDPTKPYGHQATMVEQAITEGFELHGTPMVWREQLLQAVVRRAKAEPPTKKTNA